MAKLRADQALVARGLVDAARRQSEEAARHADKDVVVRVGEGFEEAVVGREVGDHPQLDLAVVGGEEDAAGACAAGAVPHVHAALSA